MKSRGIRFSLRTVLIAVLCVVAAAIATGAVVAGVVESDRTASAKKVTPSTHPPTAYQTRPAVVPTTNAPVSTPSPTATTTPTAKSVEVVTPVPAPPVVPDAKLTPPAIQSQPTRPRARECPAGKVTSTLDSIEYEETIRYGHPEVAVTGRGTITNGTTAAVQIMQTDVPDLEGLDERGQIQAIQTYGTYDWAPPPGTPSGGVIDLQPGQTLSFTVVDSNYGAPTTVKYWYSSTESGSVMMYFTDLENAMCHVFGMPDKVGTSIPNTYVPKTSSPG